MIPPLKDFPFALRPMIAAHRGDTSMNVPENSVEAIAAAMISGADMIEFDVQWTLDEVFVCYHNEAIPLEDGTSRLVHLHKWQELDALKRGQTPLYGLTKFSDVLKHVAGRVYLNIEIKEYSNRDPKKFMYALEQMLREAHMEEHVLFASFRIDYLRAGSWSIPSVIIQPTNHMQLFFETRSASRVDLKKSVEELLPSELMEVAHATAYACQLDELTDTRMDDIIRRNLFLCIYTIATDEDFDRAVGRGAKALVCEEPAKFATLRNERFKETFSTEL
jgi:glycerophosphoryl diester phosphodiesterase